MERTERVEFRKNELKGIDVVGYRETMFFSTVEGQLCQWIEVDLEPRDGMRKLVTLEIRSRGRSATRSIVMRRDATTVRCYAPVCWPDPPDPKAELVVTWRGVEAVGRITVGSHRPWTLYLLSDCCADDAWAYGDLEAHDRDDYLTTVAELEAGPENSYNYPSVYQMVRFFRQATPAQKRALKRAVREGRFFISPVPNQLSCGLFTLSAYPLLLEPYRRWAQEIEGDLIQRTPAYHMEAPTWTNGYANLLSCAGFGLFGKSLLRFLAPWMDLLEELPVLTRLEVAPKRFMYFVLRCNTYSEGMRLLEGQPQLNRLVLEETVPRYVDLGEEYPTSAIPIVGMYSDVQPDLPEFAAAKCRVVDEYNAQEWEYPRLVNGSWLHFAEHVERELGDANRPKRPGLRTIRGGIGASWEGWVISAQAEAGRFRRAQRDVVSVRTLDAMVGRDRPGVPKLIEETVMEVVELGDHAWNGAFLESQLLNLRIRRGRLARGFTNGLGPGR